MRESRTFAERTKVFTSDTTRKKYFFVYEGSETEAIYFDMIKAMREGIGISPLIELIPIIRSYSEKGWSNPKKILDRIADTLEEDKTNHISYETLMNRIMDCFYEMRVITTSKVQARGIWTKMCNICEEKFQKTLDSYVEDLDESGNILLAELETECEIGHIISDISDIIKESMITYKEGFDQICLIVDRDRQSFVSEPENNQYRYVVNRCREKGFGLYVTNPCFEFWLLMHFDEVTELDREKLLENPKVTAKRRYAEHELRRIWPGYKKSSYNAEMLAGKINKAIKNEKLFCEDIIGLENNIGSNIGKLIETMKTHTV